MIDKKTLIYLQAGHSSFKMVLQIQTNLALSIPYKTICLKGNSNHRKWWFSLFQVKNKGNGKEAVIEEIENTKGRAEDKGNIDNSSNRSNRENTNSKKIYLIIHRTCLINHIS